MGLDLAEAWTALSQLPPLAIDIQNAIKSLPPKESRTFLSYLRALGVPEGTPLYRLGALVEQLEKDAKD